MATLLRKLRRGDDHKFHVRDLFTAPTVTSNGNATEPATTNSTALTPPLSSVNIHIDNSNLSIENLQEGQSAQGVGFGGDSAEVESHNNRPQQQGHTLFTGLRKKLTSKASTFSLRSRHRFRRAKSFDPQRTQAQTSAIFPDLGNPGRIRNRSFERDPSVPAPLPPLPFRLIPPPSASQGPPPPPPPSPTPAPLQRSSLSIARHIRRVTSTPHQLRSLPNIADYEAEIEVIRQQQLRRRSEGYTAYEENTLGDTIVGRMASGQATPPISFERLKQLTTEACSETLSDIKSYSHADTESWNTKIINTILAALVTESTPSATVSGDSPSQPDHKFIVNSTIIQHAPVASSASEDVVKSAGRRGMHSASGAFWNNEKDGMWSFKYEAAEAKGLDVVVGIVWIWVG